MQTIEVDWGRIPDAIARMGRYPVPVTGRSKKVDEIGAWIRSGEQTTQTPDRMQHGSLEFVKEFSTRLEDDFRLDSWQHGLFDEWDPRIRDENFQNCIYPLPTQYAAELYRLQWKGWGNQESLVRLAWENRRALPGALGGAWIALYNRNELPHDRWIHMLDMPENSYFTGDGDNLATTKVGYCCGGWNFKLVPFRYEAIAEGEYIIFLREVTTPSPYPRNGWT